MAISYLEISVIQSLTNDELVKRYNHTTETWPLTEDEQDFVSVIEDEMESRGLPHP